MTHSPSQLWRLLPLALTLATVGACKQLNDKQLGGSLAASVDMHFDHVRAYRIGPKLIIAFQLDKDLPPQVAGLGTPVPTQVLRLVFDTSRQTLVQGSDVQLVGNDDFPNAAVSRYTISAQGTTPVQDPALAPLTSGTIFFDKLGNNVGDPLKGHVSGKLTDGQDFVGDFDTTLVAP